MSQLAHRIKARREELGLTQEEVAKQVGIKQQSYQAIETGATKKPRFLYEISLALKCDMSWLLSGKTLPHLTPATLKACQIPLINYAQVLQWADYHIQKESIKYDYILASLELSDRAFALEINGDSMAPEFREGDLIIIEPAITPKPGEFVVAVSGEREATFKKYRELEFDVQNEIQFELIPLNNDYLIMSSLNQSIRIIGTLVEQRIFRRKR
ncbi:LexA family transcriptional regulator [Utexia brackfieldae]|uniref:LexA family protein n=1 Tax=Utexia brackfieldae TaxID=3074108 RepID=UPI00370DBF4F